MCFGTLFVFYQVENNIAMKKIILTTALSFALVASVMAQDKIWSLDDCMRYAVENSPKVKQQLYTNNTYKAEQQSAIASFLPSISTQVDAQYRFGRSVDPETNTYRFKCVSAPTLPNTRIVACSRTAQIGRASCRERV